VPEIVSKLFQMITAVHEPFTYVLKKMLKNKYSVVWPNYNRIENERLVHL